MGKAKRLQYKGETFAGWLDVRAALEDLAARIELLPETDPVRHELVDHGSGLLEAATARWGEAPELPPEEEPDTEREDETDDPAAGLTELGVWLAARPETPAGFQLCPLCAGMAVTPAGLSHDPLVETCKVCHGHGVLLTGSLRSDAATRVCTACSGAGYATRVEPVPIGAEQRTGEPQPGPVAVAPRPLGAPAYEPYVPAAGEPTAGIVVAR